MSFNDIYFRRLINSEAEMEELDEAIEEGLDLHFSEMASEDGADGRKTLEELYEKRIYLQYVSARTFHPFSEFGRLCLEKARKVVDEYEENIGPLTSGITRDNVERFKGSLTVDLIDDIRTGKCRAIGALRNDGEGVSGVGALVYALERDRLDDEYVIRVKWLFVKEKFRNRGVATSLLGELIGKCLGLGYYNILFEVPVKHEWNQAYYKLLSDWHFEFEAGLAPQLYLRMSDVELIDELLDLADNVKPLKKLPPDLIKYLSGTFEEGYIDLELSCYIGKGNSVLGALLVHRLPSGMIRMERMDGDQEYGPSLFSFMIISAKEICDDDTMVELFAESTELNDYFDAYYETHLRTLVMLASLQKPYGVSDTSVEEAIEILVE